MQSIADAGGADARALEGLARADAEAYARVTDARRLPHTSPEESRARQAAIELALLDATRIPLQVAGCCTCRDGRGESGRARQSERCDRRGDVAGADGRRGVPRGDFNVRVNANDMTDGEAAVGFRDEALSLVAAADRDAAVVSAIVEQGVVKQSLKPRNALVSGCRSLII